MSTPATEGRSEGDLADALMSAVNRATRGRVHLDGEEADMVLRLLGPSPSAGTWEMSKPLVYVAGPISGNPWGCVRQATEAFGFIRVAGCVPFLPQLSVLHEMVAPMPYEDWLAYDFDVIARCDALVRIAGESPGADREEAFADSLGIPVFAFSADPNDTPSREWNRLADWAEAWTRTNAAAQEATE